jgi:translation initiation factor IF-1
MLSYKEELHKINADAGDKIKVNLWPAISREER